MCGLLVAGHRLQRVGSAAVAYELSCSVACGIFLDQGSNPCPLHGQADSSLPHHHGSPLPRLLFHIFSAVVKISPHPSKYLCSPLSDPHHFFSFGLWLAAIILLEEASSAFHELLCGGGFLSHWAWWSLPWALAAILDIVVLAWKEPVCSRVPHGAGGSSSRTSAVSWTHWTGHGTQGYGIC